MKKLLFLAVLLLGFAACEDKEEDQNYEKVAWTRPMYVSINSEIFEEGNNSVRITSEEGGEFTIRTEHPSRVAEIYEYGDSFDLPIGKEYGCVEIYIDGVEYVAYGTYFSDRMTYGAQNELISTQYPWTYVLPWAFDHREWYEIVQLEDSKIQLTVKPCKEHRILTLGLFSINPSSHKGCPFGACTIECLPATE